MGKSAAGSPALQSLPASVLLYALLTKQEEERHRRQKPVKIAMPVNLRYKVSSLPAPVSLPYWSVLPMNSGPAPEPFYTLNIIDGIMSVSEVMGAAKRYHATITAPILVSPADEFRSCTFV